MVREFVKNCHYIVRPKRCLSSVCVGDDSLTGRATKQHCVAEQEGVRQSRPPGNSVGRIARWEFGASLGALLEVKMVSFGVGSRHAVGRQISREVPRFVGSLWGAVWGVTAQKISGICANIRLTYRARRNKEVRLSRSVAWWFREST